MTTFDWSKVSVRQLEPLPRQGGTEPFALLPLTWAAKAAAAANTPKALSLDLAGSAGAQKQE
jgi:hypothetical protein